MTKRPWLRSQWLAGLALFLLAAPLLWDAQHHLRGTEMHLPHSARLHHYRALSPVVFAFAAAVVGVAAWRTADRWERAACFCLLVWFAYEAVRFAWWVRTHHLLQGPWSWLFWVPAIVFLALRFVELKPQNPR